MSNLSMVEAELPPGFRFHPRDEELICDYLMKKVTCSSECPLLVEVDLNKSEPWDIPESACVGGKEWYFYSQRDRKYSTGLRTNRATVSGYWKATGKDRAITGGRGGTLVGMRKTLVFYQGRAPKGRKTEWVMHEFRLEGALGPPTKEDWVLCRVFYKSRSEVPGKQGMETRGRGYDEARTSSSLPPLMDSYITFDDQIQTNITNNEYEQVPCFSIFTPNQMVNPNITNINNHMEPSIPAKSSCTSNNNFGGIPDLGIPDLGGCLHPLSCDQKVLKEVLSHLSSPTSIRGLPSLGSEGSSEGFFSDVGFPYHCS